MIAKSLAFVAAAAMAATPCIAAEPWSAFETGERTSSASAGIYFAVPFGGERSGRPQAGLRLRMNHDYRITGSTDRRSVGTDTLELRFLGEERPTLFVANMPVTGREAERQNMMGGGLVTVAIIGLAIVGGLVIWNQIDDDDDDNNNNNN